MSDDNNPLFDFPAVRYRANAERARLIYRAAKLRAEIAQMFADAASWNANSDHAVVNGPLMIDDVDPDGRLRALADRLDRMLRRELPHAYAQPTPPPFDAYDDLL